MTRTLLAILAAVLIAVGLAAAPASAAVRNVSDPADRDIPSSHDIRSVRYDNGGRYITVKTKVRDLRNVNTMVQTRFSIAPQRRAGQNFLVAAARFRGQRPVVDLFIESRNRPAPQVLACRNLSASFNNRSNRVQVRVPQFCLGEGVGTQRMTTRAGYVGQRFDKTRAISVRRN